jgi:hypothetical protein
MSGNNIILATVSGSFHRHLNPIVEAVRELHAHAVHVVSPADPTIVGSDGDFLFVASDRVRSIRLVQDRHLEALSTSDFLWLVTPDGYVGQSASMELGYATAHAVPIYTMNQPSDLTLRQYVTLVPSINAAIHRSLYSRRSRPRPSILVDPHASIEDAHRILEDFDASYKNATKDPSRAWKLYRNAAEISSLLHMPGLDR